MNRLFVALHHSTRFRASSRTFLAIFVPILILFHYEYHKAKLLFKRYDSWDIKGTISLDKTTLKRSCELSCNDNNSVIVTDINDGKIKFNHSKVERAILGYRNCQLSLTEYAEKLDKPYHISTKIKRLHKQWSYNLRMVDMGNISFSFLQNPPSVNWELHPRQRKDRFPSIQRRLQYYMGIWYNTTVDMTGVNFERYTAAFPRSTHKIDHQNPLMINPLELDPVSLSKCYLSEKPPTKAYCKDIVDFALLHSHGSASAIVHFGDSAPDPPSELDKYPYIAKVRRLGRTDNIIWPLNRKRHYTSTLSIPFFDSNWENKTSKIVWRGGPKGEDVRLENNTFTHESKSLSVRQKWSLIKKYANSSAVDAKFVISKRKIYRYSNIPKAFTGEYYDYRAQLKYKYLLSLEGNDVASGLKWMLFSNSLVFMPPTTYISWAMESLLEPFVHYIPLKADLSDLEDMISWADNHPKDAQMIAERATLFVHDLFFHPDALRDEELILQGMMEIYEQNFGSNNRLVHKIPNDFDLLKHPPHRLDRFPTVSDRVAYYMCKWFNSSSTQFIENARNDKEGLHSHNQPNKNDFKRVNLHVSCPSMNHMNDTIRNTCVQYLTLAESMTSKLKIRDPPKNSVVNQSALVHIINDLHYLDDIASFSEHRLSQPHIHKILWPRYSEQDERYNWVMSGIIEKSDRTFHKKSASVVIVDASRTADELYNVVKAIRSSANILSFNHEYQTRYSADDLPQILSHKYLLLLQRELGPNLDLMWALLSQSVVLMPWPVKYTSWFMEDLLKPFVHFVPVNLSLTDVDEAIHWCEDANNREIVQKIKEASTLYVHDFFFHPGADRDEEKIKTTIIERYLELAVLNIT